MIMKLPNNLHWISPNQQNLSLTIRPVCPVWGRNPNPFFVFGGVSNHLRHEDFIRRYAYTIRYGPDDSVSYDMMHIVCSIENPWHRSFIDIWYNSLVHDVLMKRTNKRSSWVTNKMHSDLISIQDESNESVTVINLSLSNTNSGTSGVSGLGTI